MQKRTPQPPPKPHHSPFAVAAEADLLPSLAPDGSRKFIHPVVNAGRYLRGRKVVGWVLIVLFFGLPHLRLGGVPAVQIDIQNRITHFFGATLHPTENLILLAFGAAVIVTVFFVTAVFGRIWCGWGCPQVVYLEFIYRPIETLIEGKPARRRRLADLPWTSDKIWRKALKWTIFIAISGAMATTFIAYFVGWQPLFHRLLTAPGEHMGLLWTTLGLTGLILFDFGSFRDQMCTVACPYGRLQTVLIDKDSLIISYDEKRGEPRGAKLRAPDDAPRGDCVDCGRCVTTCPTGIDIRKGLQMECIGCAQCIDACDDVMDRVGRPRGLVRYTSERELETGTHSFVRPRLFVYIGLMVITWGALLVLSLNRQPAEVQLTRGGNEAFQVLHTGQVANRIRLLLTNQRDIDQAFSVELLAPAGGQLVMAISPFVVGPSGVESTNVIVELPKEAFQRGKANARFRIRSDAGLDVEKEFVLLGPYR